MMPNQRHLFASTLLLGLIMACNKNAYSQLDGASVVHPDQELEVTSLPSITASSPGANAVLIASLATVIMQPDVCCDPDSALEAQIPSARNLSLKDLGEKLRGKHYLGSGLAIEVADQYWSGASVNVEDIIAALIAQHPLLIDWNGHLYVLYGAVFDEYLYSNGTTQLVLKTLSLIDTRYSDERRYVSFNRQTDDWGKLTGLLTLTITR
jgi:hypothetical protein